MRSPEEPPGRAPRGLFVTGTDTGVGKTVVAAAIVAALRAAGRAVTVRKPVITGLAEPADGTWPPDHELLALVAGCEPREVSPIGYDPPVSPHLAAELVGERLDSGRLLAAARLQNGDRDSVLVVEGVGGLLVPLGPGYDVRGLAADLGLPLVIAARPGLGTLNHTLLTLEAARRAGLRIAGVVLTPWPQQPDAIERSNRETLERLAGLPVATLPRLPRPEPQLLAGAGSGLPLGRWLA